LCDHGHMADPVGNSRGIPFEHLDRQVRRLFADITAGARAATLALVTGDSEPPKCLARQDKSTGVLQRDVERAIEEQFARYPPMGSDFRYLVTVLRVVPELERSADLVDHIAARVYLTSDLSMTVIDTVVDMGRLTGDMWQSATEAWATVDPDAARLLDTTDDRVDYLTATLPGLLAADGVPARIAIELALVGRFYERLADHAVHIASRIRWLAKGA
jgi:phosphate transport system protein